MPDRDDEIRRELESHLEMRAELLEQKEGLSSSDARAEAQRRFGNRLRVQEDARAVHLAVWLESTVQDLKHAAHSFLRQPLFTLTVVMTLGLGVGASTAVFSVIDRILFRPLAYAEPDRLVSVGLSAPIEPVEFLPGDNYFDLLEQHPPFTAITSFTAGATDCDLAESNPLRFRCRAIEPNFLAVLGVAPIIGRGFTNEENLPNGPRVALISHSIWQTRYGADPSIAGRAIPLDGQPTTVVGVLPPAFELPNGASADILLPQRLAFAPGRTGGFVLRAFARLRPGVSAGQAEAELAAFFKRTLERVPGPFRKEVKLRIRSVKDLQIDDAKTASWTLFAAVLSVLLIACANIANLLLARAESRRREMAMRAALGASRARLIRQALTECLLLAGPGAILGAAIAAALLRLFVRISPDGIPRLAEAAIDGRVLAFALVASVGAALLFGLAPALATPRPDTLAGGWRSAGSRRTWLRPLLVAGQIAFSVILLTAAGLLLRSLWNMQNQRLGIDASSVTTAEISLGRYRYPKPEQMRDFFDRLETEFASLPVTVALADSVPPIGGTRAMINAAIDVEGRPALPEGTGGMVPWRLVTPDYFHTLRIPILRGRAFTEADRSAQEPAIIFSRTLAARVFPSEDPIGKRIRLGRSGGWKTIVGVAEDVFSPGVRNFRELESFYVVHQRGLPQPPRSAFLIVRSSLSAAATTSLIRERIGRLDPSLPLRIEPLSDRVDRLSERSRFNAALLGLFALLGLILAPIGLYGVVGFLVSESIQEIGVRMALGATRWQVTSLFLRRAAAWIAAGSALGAVGAVASGRALNSMLYDVQVNRPENFLIILLLMGVVALTAAWLAARRASQVDPLVALRQD